MVNCEPITHSSFAIHYSQLTISSMFTHHLFGIRHHGPGSASSLLQALSALAPDLILIEGPPDADDLITWAGHPDMVPPIALLVYRPDDPQRAIYYPFAVFSPEWQALRYAANQQITARFMDLPQAHQMAVNTSPQLPDSTPLQLAAQAAGYPNYEAWWNVLIEQRRDNKALFTAVLELITALRNAADEAEPEDESEQAAWALAQQREAYMRHCLRQAKADGFQRVAVVCGAWHTPALQAIDTAAQDDQQLHNLPHVQVKAAWVPWTYGRLSAMKGYGAGVRSPGWYHHLWQMRQANATHTDSSIQWLTRVAHLLRQADLDASSAHIIEAVRLAETLAALRDLSVPGLTELNEAVQATFTFGDATPLHLIKRQLIVGERMGGIPSEIPMLPLQQDLQKQQRALYLHPEPTTTRLSLDLRQERDLARSHLLHRLRLLNTPWGTPKRSVGQSGTYLEQWALLWQPDLAVRLIEASVWGHTVVDAAATFAQHRADEAQTLSTLTDLLDQVILADLPDTIFYLMERIENEAALSSDIPHLMDALLPLARVLRYGNVRQTDKSIIRHVVAGLFTRICIGLPTTCASMDDAAANGMLDKITAVHDTLHTLQNHEQIDRWHQTLAQLTDQPHLHGLIAGRTCRLLLNDTYFTAQQAATRMERALSLPSLAAQTVEQLSQMAFWLEGFLRGSELLILHDQTLWQLLDNWVTTLANERFQEILPLLRRTFASFSEAARRQLSQRVRIGQAEVSKPTETAVAFDHASAKAVLPLVAQLLGLPYNPDAT